MASDGSGKAQQTDGGVLSRVWRMTSDPVTVIRTAMLTAIVVWVVARTWADPDLWGHLQFGRDILEAGAIPRVDHYAFTSDVSWVNHEWLAEILMSLAWQAGGPIGLVGLKLLLALGTLGFLLVVFERSGLPLLVRDIGLPLVAVAVSPWTMTVRPQLFSLFLFMALLATLRAVDRGRRGALAAVPFIMLAWCNLHGGWLVGMAVFLPWLAFEFFDRRVSWRARCGALLVGVLAAGATLLNPYGAGLWVFLWRTVGLNRPDISEWQPLWHASTGWAVVWLGLVTMAVVVTTRYGRVSGRYLASLLLFAFASLRVVRLIPFFGLAAVYWLAPALSVPRDAHEPVASAAAERWRAPYWRVAFAAILVSGTVALGVMNRCIRVTDAWDPPDLAAARFIEARQISGRMVTWFDWGEYAIWHLSPRVRVSMDGRRETVYSEAVLAKHRLLYAGEPKGLAYLASLDADYVWLPVSQAVVGKLGAAGWHPIFRSGKSVIFSRHPVPAAPPSQVSGPICFPGG